MSKLFRTLCQLFWGKFLFLTSLYCLLAFLPYTYVALVKAPPYTWILWFIAHYTVLYWTAWAAGVIAYYPGRRGWGSVALLSLQALLGFYLPGFMGRLQCDWRAYAFALIPLFLIIGIAAQEELTGPEPPREAVAQSNFLLNYSTGLVAAVGVAILAAGVAARGVVAAGNSVSRGGGLELAAWSVVSHALIAIVVISILNLISLATFPVAHRRMVKRAIVAGLVFGGLWFGVVRFLENSLSFNGWRAHLYAASLAAALTLIGFSITAPYLAESQAGASNGSHKGRRLKWIALAVGLVIANVALPSVIGEGDWNGLLQSSLALIVWSGLSVCAYRLRSPGARYSMITIVAVLLLSGFAYESLRATEIFWGKPLGSTDDDIARAMEAYAGRDASFALAHSLLGNTRSENCGDLCRIMREYTDIRDAQVNREINLVDPLTPEPGDHPNIFVFVIDSLRPDYLGAYNAKVDFSPNLDAFARDSVIVHNVYTQYAGTSLSEPGIWAGMMLLHSHYMQPFSRVNSLEKLASVDGYKMIVSEDEVLRQVLSPSDNRVKLDTDKPLWNELEVCSTIQQTEHVLDSNSAPAQPIFFYTQPKNVHQFAHNNLPGMRASHWQARAGFVDRIAYEVHQADECMGGFFAYLKKHALYDSSIIILTSDHGDATGELGRSSHSLSIYPEVMRVPLIVHLPQKMRGALVYDDTRVSALTDIAPSLYYLLGHRPIMANPMFGRPLFMDSLAELHRYQRDELFLASDERAVYGILADHGRYLYATYDSPPQSYLYDLENDPTGIHDVLTPALKKDYDERIIDHLQTIGAFYGYKPRLSTLLSGKSR